MIRKLIAALRRKPKYVYRSAITGKFVSEAYWRSFPDQTVRERVA